MSQVNLKYLQYEQKQQLGSTPITFYSLYIILYTQFTLELTSLHMIYCLKRGGFWSCLRSVWRHLRNPLPFISELPLLWQSDCSDQRKESQAVARFVFSHSVT